MRYLIILLFISFSGFSQTYEDLMSINSLETFKKVCLENGYQKINLAEFFQENTEDSVEITSSDGTDMDDFVTYSYQETARVANWNPTDNTFAFTYQKNAFLELFMGEDEKSVYDEIVDDIKENCKFYKIAETVGDIEFVTYSCSQSLYKGKIGFATNGDIQVIRLVPNEALNE